MLFSANRLNRIKGTRFRNPCLDQKLCYKVEVSSYKTKITELNPNKKNPIILPRLLNSLKLDSVRMRLATWSQAMKMISPYFDRLVLERADLDWLKSIRIMSMMVIWVKVPVERYSVRLREKKTCSLFRKIKMLLEIAKWWQKLGWFNSHDGSLQRRVETFKRIFDRLWMSLSK